MDEDPPPIPSLWQLCIDVIAAHVQEFLPHLPPLPQHCVAAVHAAAAQQGSITSEALIQLAPLLGNATEIRLALCRVSGRAMTHLLQHTAAVEVLDLSGTAATDAVVRTAAAACPRLRDVRLFGSRLITDAGVCALGGERLEALDVSLCQHLTDAGVLPVLRRSPGLRLLGLSWSDRFSDELCREVARSCRGLRTLLAACASDLSNDALAALFRACTALTKLDLSARSTLDADTLGELARHCPALEHLDLGSCSGLDATAVLPLRSLRRLRYLRLDDCRALTGAALQLMGEPAGCPPALEGLDFALARGPPAALASVLRQCPRLTALNLHNSACVTDGAVHTLAQHCTAVRDLDLTGAEGIHDGAVRALAAALGPRLRTLRLSWATALTGEAMAAVAAHCGQLRSLRAARTGADDAAVSALASGCAWLQDLDLAGCELVGDAALAALARCASLQRLNLQGCPRVTDGGLHALLAGRPRLEALALGGQPLASPWPPAALACGALRRLEVLLLSGCRSLAAPALLQLLPAAPALELLTLDDCAAAVDDAAAAAAAAHCPRLETLSLAGCPRVGTAGALLLLQRLPRLAKLTLATSPVLDGAAVACAARERAAAALRVPAEEGEDAEGYGAVRPVLLTVGGQVMSD